uniref:Short-chain dehydrogenase/reductase SDR n=1 Tax=Caulobacter sp. (strain K31) TaxID=366602 RepID=B0T7E3_CAUSK
MSLRNKSVLLTGGAGGLGSLVSRRLDAAGARVTVLDRLSPADGADVLIHDLSTPDGVEAAVADVEGRDWDVLVNLAGIQHFGPLELQSADHLLASYLVNLVAPARLTQAVLPRMKARRAGQIVNIGSVFGSIGFAHFVTYSSAKAGLRVFSEALRRELVETGVAVTYIAPRAMRTPLITPKLAQFAKMTRMPLDEPDKVASLIVDAIRTRRRDFSIGLAEFLYIRLNALAPDLVDRALLSNGRKARTLFVD